MPQFDLICLANSRKHGGRCVAGLRTDGSGWLRPVGRMPDGTLYPTDYTLDDYTEAGPLDVIRVGVTAPRPECHQPENWVIDGSTWQLAERPAGPHLSPVLQAAIRTGAELLTGYSDRLSHADLQQHPVSTSLALVAPKELELYHQLSYSGRPQVRARFTLGSGARATTYNLSVTDPTWESRVISGGPKVFRNPADRALATVSLGEELRGFCYKLIAAVILIPPRISVSFS